ncbi:MAG: aspartate--tRNA ligase [Wenzhouxiangellaceae bacterium]
MMRSHYCGRVDESLAGQRVLLSGWVQRRRDLGGLIFIGLRDHEGVVQVVVEPDNAEAFAVASELRNEYCIQISGKVRLRPEEQWNAQMRTGKIEVVAENVFIHSRAAPLPLLMSDEDGEEVRLRYRFLDLRRARMQRNLRQRAHLTRSIRHYLDQHDFVDVETPVLTRATPEGARDYLVPSRVHAGQFYALPQSPQLFKQLLIMGGIDRYYQIARCFRDEDLRADRQPEFTQLDMELAFVDEKDVQKVAENMIRQVFKQVLDVELPPFPRLTYAEAMERYGSDKPDLRIPLELVTVDQWASQLDFKVFAGPASDDQGRVAALRVPGGAELSRKQIDELGSHAAKYGAKGLAWMKVNDVAAGLDGVQSSFSKFLDDASVRSLLSLMAAENEDLILFGAGPAITVSTFMGALRLKAGKDRGLINNGWQPLWVVDFPMFEWDEDSQRWFALHHPFTAPKAEAAEQLQTDPGRALSRAYDMVLNGMEIGGGSIRIHQNAMQQTVFDLLGINAEEAQERFGFLLEALKYGCPPLGGIAFGIDRISALMAGEDSIRDVMAFPKTANATCLLTDAPSAIEQQQLDELHIRPLMEATEQGQ